MDTLYDIGDLVELQVYLRKPKLRGISVKHMDYNDKIGEVVYYIFCFNFDPPRFYRWPQSCIRKLV